MESLCKSCMGDEGRPLGIGFQEQVSNHLKPLWLRAMVVSVEVKRGERTRSRYGSERRTQVNLRWGVVTCEIAVETRGVSPLWDELVGHLITGQVAAGV